MNICLIVVVRNESDDIINYLELNKTEFDTLFIIEIDSNDNTVEIIQQWCLKNNILLTIHKSDKLISGNKCLQLARSSYPNMNGFRIVD